MIFSLLDNNGACELTSRTVLAQRVQGPSKTEYFQRKLWQQVSSDENWVTTPHTRWVSVGKNFSREKLFFDANSHKMNELKSIAVNLCLGQPISIVLKVVNEIINNLTAKPGKTRQEVEKELTLRIKQYLKAKRANLAQGQTLQVNMDELIDKKLLICRHKALMATSILAYLVNLGILPPGQVRQYRSNLKDSNKSNKKPQAHTWATYRNNQTGELWICDPRWNLAKEIFKEYQTLLRSSGYGDITLKDMVKRLNQKEALKPFIDLVSSNNDLAGGVSSMKLETGTTQVPGQHILLTFKMNSKAGIAFMSALTKQGIQFEKKSNGDQLFLIIRAISNPRIFQLDAQQFSADYRQAAVSSLLGFQRPENLVAPRQGPLPPMRKLLR